MIAAAPTIAPTLALPLPLAAPPPRHWVAEPARAIAGVLSLIGARRSLLAAPKGDGRAVMLLPGLFNGDRAMLLMRRYLNWLGYRAEGWQLGVNFGARTIDADGERLFARIEALAATRDARRGDAGRDEPGRDDRAARRPPPPRSGARGDHDRRALCRRSARHACLAAVRMDDRRARRRPRRAGTAA